MHFTPLGDLAWGGEHTIQYSDDVLWNCALETYITLFTNVTNKFDKNFLNAFLFFDADMHKNPLV